MVSANDKMGERRRDIQVSFQAEEFFQNRVDTQARMY